MRSRSGTRAGLEPQTVWSSITTTVPVYEQALSHPANMFFQARPTKVPKVMRAP